MKKILLAILTLLYVFILVITIIPFKNYNVTLPGNVTNVNTSLSFEEEVGNNFYTTYVISYNKPTLLQMFLTNIYQKASLNENQISELNNASFLDEELSFQYATILAYNEAKKNNNDISINYEFVGYAITSSKDKNVLGDIIIKIDDFYLKDITYEYLANYLDAAKQINVRAIRNKKEVNYQLTKNGSKFYLSLRPFYEITNLYPNYSKLYDKDTIGGPSGGLIQALYIYYQITNTKIDLKIGGTGTIDNLGIVGKIGGIKEKIFTANNKVDLFFVPKDNYSDALLAYQKLSKKSFDLIMVESFDEALSYLKGLN